MFSSISEMSATAQQRYQKLLNSNSPAFVLFQQLENFETALKDRMKARDASLLRLESQIEKYSDFSQKEEIEGKAPEKFTIGNFVVEVE
jgi:bifunctional ADP-heptose synthase (sugar kinase/adenylyltransferase)